MGMIRYVKTAINKVFNPSTERPEANLILCDKCNHYYPKSWVKGCPYCAKDKSDKLKMA